MSAERKPLDLDSLRGHTPGPRCVVAGKRATRLRVEADGVTVATVECASANCDEAKAEAALIAAAPDLLAELTERRAKDALVAELVEASAILDREINDATDCLDIETAMSSNGVSNARDRLSAALAALRGRDGV